VCPAVVVAHCARWLEDVDAAIPTVVIKARAGGADVTNVSVSVDGTKVVDALDGQALPIEPGSHLLRYVRAGASATVVEERVLVVAGEKNRLLLVDFASVEAPRSAPPAPVASSSGAPDAPRASVSPFAWVFGGVASAAAGSFAYFGATGKSDLDSLRATCAGHCDNAGVSAAWNKLIVADVSLGVGVVSLGAAVWLFLSPRRSMESEAGRTAEASPLVVTPALVGPRGVSLGWRGVF
jgi:hypothetical protein